MESVLSTLPHQARLIPLLEPLCQATATQLAPLKTFPNDRLTLDIDDEGRRFVAKLHTTDDTRPPSQSAQKLWDRIPEMKDLPSKEAYVKVLAGTDVTALVIYHAWPQDQLLFGSDDAKVLYEFLLKRFLVQSRNSALIANFKVNHTAPEMPADFIDHPDLPLTPYQKVAFMTAIEREASSFFMEQGTGKTAPSISICNHEAMRKATGKYAGRTDMYKVLIVCPKQVRTNWANEFKRFSVCNGKVTVIRGGAINRVKCLVNAMRREPGTLFSVVIIGVDSVERTWEALQRIPWDRCILDESHKIKNSRTHRFKIMRQLRDICDRRSILTGTPIANSMMDLWAQLEFLGDGLSGFMGYENYKRFYGEWKKAGVGHGVEKLVAIKNVPLIQERLARLSFMVTKKEANLNLPDKVYDIYEVEMTKSQQEYYKRVQDQLALEIKAGIDTEEPGKRLTAEHILTKLLRLSQITSGFIKWDDVRDPMTGDIITKGLTEQIPGVNPKVDAVVEMLKDEDRDPNGKTIVWCKWVQDIHNVVVRLKQEGIPCVTYYGATSEKDREEAVRRFNADPECQVFVCNAATAGEGLNLLGYDYWNQEPALETYCDHEIFFSEGWSFIERSQAEARAHRRGTRCNLRITTLIAPATIDQEIYDRLMFKQEMASLIQDLRTILSRILESDPGDGDE